MTGFKSNKNQCISWVSAITVILSNKREYRLFFMLLRSSWESQREGHASKGEMLAAAKSTAKFPLVLMDSFIYP